MDDNSVSAIDGKNNNANATESVSNWKGFAISVIVNLFVFLILILIGSNYVFMVHFNALETLFPKDIKKYFPNGGNLRGGTKTQKGGSADFTTYARTSSTNNASIDILKYTEKLSGWPYSMYKKTDTFSWQQLKNWFALTQANTFITYRKLMYTLYTGDYNEEGTNLLKQLPNPVLYLMGVLVPILVSIFILPLMAFISTIFFSFTSETFGWLYALVGFIFVLSLSNVNIIIQEVSLYFNIFITPLFINYESVLSIARSNVKWLTMIFGLLVIGSAFANLDNTTSGIMTIAYIGWIIKQYFF